MLEAFRQMLLVNPTNIEASLRQLSPMALFLADYTM